MGAAAWAAPEILYTDEEEENSKEGAIGDEGTEKGLKGDFKLPPLSKMSDMWALGITTIEVRITKQKRVHGC